MDRTNEIKYIVMQICYIPSIICCIFSLFHFFFNRNLRLALHNHISFILLLVSLCDLLFNHPFTLVYLRVGQVIPSNDTFCLLWNFVNTIFIVSTYWTMAWGTFERHLLIFYSSLYVSRRKRIFIHYIPICFISIFYPIAFSIIVILSYPCTNHFNMLSLFCANTCALKVQPVALYARIAHNFLPVFIVTISTILLIQRVIKRKLNHRFNWRRYRRMCIQLIALTSLFLSLTLPITIVSIIQNCCIINFAATIQSVYLNFFVRFLTIFMPFICFSSLPEIWPKCLTVRQTRTYPVHT